MLRQTWILCMFSVLIGAATMTSVAAQNRLPHTWRTAEIRSLKSDAVKGMEYKIVVTLPSDY